jgi:hypothetical protein
MAIDGKSGARIAAFGSCNAQPWRVFVAQSNQRRTNGEKKVYLSLVLFAWNFHRIIYVVKKRARLTTSRLILRLIDTVAGPPTASQKSECKAPSNGP